MAIDSTPTPRRTPPITHLDEERAQPGDVLGIEHDGAVTELGDTSEDEDERLEDAEDAVEPDRD